MRCWSSRGLPPAYRWHPLSGGQCRFHHLFSPHRTFFSQHLKRKESLVLCFALTKITELFTVQRLSVKCHPRPCYARNSAEREDKGGQLIPRGFYFHTRARRSLQRKTEGLWTGYASFRKGVQNIFWQNTIIFFLDSLPAHELEGVFWVDQSQLVALWWVSR